MTRNTDLNTFGIVWTPGGPLGAGGGKNFKIFKIFIFHSISLEMTRNTDLNTFGIVWTPGGPLGAGGGNKFQNFQNFQKFVTQFHFKWPEIPI